MASCLRFATSCRGSLVQSGCVPGIDSHFVAGLSDQLADAPLAIQEIQSGVLDISEFRRHRVVELSGSDDRAGRRGVECAQQREHAGAGQDKSSDRGD